MNTDKSKAKAEAVYQAAIHEWNYGKAQHSPLPRLTEAEAKENMRGAYITLADGRTQYCEHLSERERKACNEYDTLKAHADKLAEALRGCMADLDHYASTHGPGPDRRRDTAKAALAAYEKALQ